MKRTNWNPKKKILVLFLVVIIVALLKVATTNFYNKININEYGETTLQALGEPAPENDAYISSATMIQVKTGTGPFDSDDEPGNDTSDSNNIVRSFDQVTWTIEANMKLKEGTTVVNKKGGTINIEATLPEECEGLMQWDLDSMGWTNGTGTTSNNARTFTAKYKMNEEAVTIPGKQTLVLVLKVDGASNNTIINPTIKVWLDGNEIEEKCTVSNVEDIKVSAAPRYNVKLIRNGNLSNKATVDYGEGNIAGRMYGYGVLLELYNNSVDKGLKGIEYPNGDIKFDINLKLTRTEFQSTAQTDITSECTPVLWNYNINNDKDRTGNITNRDIYSNGNAYHYYVNNMPKGVVLADRTCSIYNSGNINMIQEGNVIHTTISNYDFDGTFPIYNYFYNNAPKTSINYKENEGVFHAGYFQVFIPDKEASTIEDRNYYLTVSNNNFNATSISGESTTIQQNTSDDSDTVNHVLYKPGTYSQTLMLYKATGGYLSTTAGAGDAKVVIGQDIQLFSKFGMSVSNDYNIYSATKFIKFDGDVVEPKLYSNGVKYKTSSYAGTMNFNVWYVTKNDGTNWVDANEMNNANIEDMLIFENIEDIPVGYICVGEYFESIEGYIAVSTGDNNCVSIALKIKDTATIGKTYGFTQTTKYWENYVDRTNYTITKSNIEEWPKPTAVVGNYNYIKTEYNENGEMIAGTHSGGALWGQSLLIIGAELSINQKAINENDNTEKKNYDIGKNEYDVTYKLMPNIASSTFSNITDITLKIEDTLPKGLTYVPGSSSNGEPEVINNADGTTKLVWYIYGCETGKSIDPIIFKAHMDEESNNGAQYENKVVVSEVIGKDGTSKIGNSPISDRTSLYSIQVINLAAHRLYKESITPVIEKNGIAQYRITYINKTDLNVPDFQLLDILPYNGDGRGTSYNGTYTLNSIEIEQIDAISGNTLSNNNLKLYATNSNNVRTNVTAKSEDLGTNEIWTEIEEGSIIDKAETAFAIIGEMPEQCKLIIDVYLKTNNNKPLDIYQNNVSAQTYKETEEIQTGIVSVEPVKRIIEGKVWLDKDKDGLIDEGEKYLKDIELTLVNSDGTVAKDINGNDITSVKTDENGYYKFEDMVKGDYKVKASFEDKYEISPKNVGTNREINSKFNTNKETDVITKLNSIQSPEIKESDVNVGLGLKDTKVIVHHYKEGTTESLSSDVTIDGQIDDEYVTQKAVDIPSKYELVETPTNAEGKMTKDTIEVIYYYKLKSSAGVIVHHVDIDTLEKIAKDESKTGKVGDEYTTSQLSNIPANYTYVKRTDNYEGEMTEEEIEVTYYYKIATPEIESSIEKSGQEKLKNKDDEVTYEIEYTANIDDYIGDVTVDIIDELPYEIDESKSNLADGRYDKINQRIIWNSLYYVDTYKEGKKEIKISKSIKVVYKNVDEAKEKITNKVIGKLNTYTPEKEDTVEDTADVKIDLYTDVTANKVWVDNDEQKIKRPESIILQVLKGSEVVASKEVTASENTSYTFKDLPKYDKNGNIINYTISEKEVNEGDLYFYTNEINENTITNTFTKPEDKINVEVNKKWVDNENQKTRRPEKITLVVKNQNNVAGRVTLEVSDNMSYTFTGLAKYDENGKEIQYTVDEEEVIENDLYFYSKTIEKNTITNTFKVPEDKIEITVSKKWTDSSKNKRPESIILQVLSGTKVVASEEVTALENTSYTFKDLPKYDENGTEIQYTVDEKEVKEKDLIGYTSEINKTTITNSIKKVPYKVEYYYSGILDEKETEIEENQEYGSIIRNI